MQYVFLLHEDETNWASLSETEQAEGVAAHMAFVGALNEASAFKAGAPLGPSTNGKLVSADGIHDGPFADSKEQVGGFYMIEAANLEEALVWAKQCPTAQYGRVEVREVPDYGSE